jgi:uncharacterized repeat protein (TIGR02543 family)
MKSKGVLLMVIVGFLPIFACTNPIVEDLFKRDKANPKTTLAVTYTVAFNSTGGSPVTSQTVAKGEKATRPVNPTRSGFGFMNWYSDPKLTAAYDFTTPVTGNITLYAEWKLATFISARGHEMVWIPAGTFTMGSPATEPSRNQNETQHQVTLTSGFYMGKYAVTQAQYEAIMGNNPSGFRLGGEYNSRVAELDTSNFPVENVRWYDILVFCNKLSKDEGLTPVYRISGSTDPSNWGTVPTSSSSTIWNAVEIVAGSNGYRLPTEAQWEYACRAGTTTAFNWGTNQITTDQANYYGSLSVYNNSPNPQGNLNRTTDVGSYAPNAWGLYDMHGNVTEWCWDWYETYKEGKQTDPDGAVSGTNRVRRDGGYSGFGWTQRSAVRFSFSPYTRAASVGFRLVKLPENVEPDIEDFEPNAVISRKFDVANTGEWNEAVSVIAGGGNDKNYIINVIDDFNVAGYTAATFGNVSGITVSLRGPGRTLSLSGNGNILQINSGQTVILRDLTLIGSSSNNSSLVLVTNTNATFTMNSGEISGNTFSGSGYTYGGGVHVTDNGTFTMTGGKISGNVSTSTGTSASTYGGGVYVNGGTFTMTGGVISGNRAYAVNSYGGGVYVSCGSGGINTVFTMTGGEISGNSTASTTYSSYGGGVHIVGRNTNPIRTTVFTMTGGKISGNTSSSDNNSYGGGVYITTNVNFTMDGGEISGNTTASTSRSSSGGGVSVAGAQTAFTMNSGKISGNIVSGLSNRSSQGGGVYVASGNTFTMTGGEVSGNSTSGSADSSFGGGVYLGSSNATFTMNGGKISGNKASTSSGGGVYVYDTGIFHIFTGTIYGSDEADPNLRNTAATGGSSLFKTATGIAQYGTFGTMWNSNGNLDTTNNTIKVVNGSKEGG